MNMPNCNPKTGIRYGVVSLNSLQDWVMDLFMYEGANLTYQAALEEAKGSGEFLDEDGDFDEDEFNQRYEPVEESYYLEHEGMKLQLSHLGDDPLVWVFESPHTCDCAGCSPCCPGAGDLDTSRDPEGDTTYDLPPEWYPLAVSKE